MRSAPSGLHPVLPAGPEASLRLPPDREAAGTATASPSSSPRPGWPDLPGTAWGTCRTAGHLRPGSTPRSSRAQADTRLPSPTPGGASEVTYLVLLTVHCSGPGRFLYSTTSSAMLTRRLMMVMRSLRAWLRRRVITVICLRQMKKKQIMHFH